LPSKDFSDGTLVQVEFRSPANAWEGYCESRTTNACEVCRSGYSRCGRHTSMVALRHEGHSANVQCRQRGCITWDDFTGLFILGAHIAMIVTNVLWCVSRRKKKDAPHPGEPLQQSLRPETNSTHAVTTAAAAFVGAQAGPAGTAPASTAAAAWQQALRPLGN
jgi:hypothetical protein